jgi:two-component system sensor histidine kinase RegB
MASIADILWPETADALPSPAAGERGLRLKTLVRLRWLAVAGQTLAVVGVHWLLGFNLPLGWCLAAIALSAWLNIFLTLRWRSNFLSDRNAALLLGYDMLQLALLLYLTGGLQNPFAFLFLVPVTVSATSLPLKWTLLLGAIAFICASLLAFLHFPLPWFAEPPLVLPSIYIFGMWSALVSGVVFSAIYARRIAVEAQQMSTALAATEQVLAREQHLTALDGLAAAAAHELRAGIPRMTSTFSSARRRAAAKSCPASPIATRRRMRSWRGSSCRSCWRTSSLPCAVRMSRSQSMQDPPMTASRVRRANRFSSAIRR